MNHFAILAHGEDFDVDAFLQSTPLRPTHAWRQGDQKRYSCEGSRHKTSGIEIELGDGKMLTTHEQQQVAAVYLAANQEALRVLARFPGARHVFVGVQRRFEVNLGTLRTCLSIRPSLMRLATEIGMRITVYIDLDWKYRCEQGTQL